MNGNIIAKAFYSSDFLGKSIFVFLFVLCILTVTILVYKVWMIQKISQMSQTIESSLSERKSTPLGLDLKKVTQTVGVPNPLKSVYETLRQNVYDLLKKNKSFLHQGGEGKGPIYLSSSDIDQLSLQVGQVIYSERKKLERYLFILPTVASLAPLLGLLGTVWGISVTFAELQNSATALANEAVLSGLSMALGTTVVGIIVAMIALISHSYLKHTLEDTTHRMDEFSSSMLSSVEMLYRAVEFKKTYG